MRNLILKISTEDKASSIIIASTTKVDVGIGDRANLSDIADWGIYSTTGVVEFVDQNNAFTNFLVGKNVKDLIVETINVEGGIDVSKFSDNIISTLKVADYDYDKQTKTYSLELYDGLTDWQDCDMPEIYFYGEWNDEIHDNDGVLCSKLVGAVVKKAKELGYRVPTLYEGTTGIVMQNLEVYIGRIKPNNLWAIFTEICELAMLRIYVDKNGVITISHIEPTTTRTAILRSRNVLEIGKKAKKSKTTIPNVSILERDLDKTFGDLITPINIPLYSISMFSGDKDFAWGKADFNASWNDYSSSEISISEGRDGELVTSNSYGDRVIYPFSNFVLSGKIKLNENTFFDVDNNGNIKDQYPYLNLRRRITTYYATGTLSSPIINEKKRDNSYAIGADKLGTDGAERYGVKLEAIDRTQKTMLITWKPHNNDMNADVAYENYLGYDDPYPHIEAFTEATISILGRYYEEKEDVEVLQYSDKFAKPKQYSNELIQTRNKWYDNDYAQYVFDSFERYYNKGLECVELLCTVSNYYDEQGNFVTDKFDLYDTVTPYVVINGKEQPYDTYSDGTPMSFRIVNIRYLYEGRVKQKIYLQEIPLTTI